MKGERETKQKCVYVCACVCVRVCVCARVCMRVWERNKAKVCVWERECFCVCKCKRRRYAIPLSFLTYLSDCGIPYKPLISEGNQSVWPSTVLLKWCSRFYLLTWSAEKWSQSFKRTLVLKKSKLVLNSMMVYYLNFEYTS